MRYLVTNFQLFRNKLKTKKHLNFFGKRWYVISEGCKLTEKEELILSVYKHNKIRLIPSAKEIDEHLGGKLTKLVKADANKIREKRPTAPDNADKVVCLGKEGKEYDELETSDQNLEREGDGKLSNDGATRTLVESLGKPEQDAKRSAVSLKSNQTNKTRQNWSSIQSLDLFDYTNVESWQIAESQNLTRQAQITLLHFAQEPVSELFSGVLALHDKDWIQTKKKQLAYLEAAQKSCEVYSCGTPYEQKPLAGMRVCLCSDVTSTYRAVLVIAANTLSLPLNIKCFALNKNMPRKCRDVLKEVSGKKMLITNTRKEKQLLSENSLTYGRERCKHKLIIVKAGVFEASADCCQVRVNDWLLLWKYFLTTEPFIYVFIWIHFDVTGVGMKCDVKFFTYLTEGRTTGRPTRTIIQLLYLLACPNPET